MAKSIAIEAHERRFSGCAEKVIKLTVGDLQRVAKATGRAERHPIAVQKSAEDVVGKNAEQARKYACSRQPNRRSEQCKEVERGTHGRRAAEKSEVSDLG